MKVLLAVKAAVEALTGLALGLYPATLVALLIGAPLEGAAGIVVARVAGTALLTMGIACWQARKEGGSRAAIGLVEAMLVYDVLVVVIFLLARFYLRLSGIGLLPVALLHAGLGIWSLVCLKRGARLGVNG
jgi:hypothetical protein